jgi:hypothetical protein
MDASSSPNPSKSSESSPRASLSERLGGLLSQPNPEAPPDDLRVQENDLHRTGVESSAAGLEGLAPACVTTPRPDSTADIAPNFAPTRAKLSSHEAGRETRRVETIYAPSAIESLQDALSEDLPSPPHTRPASSSSTGSSMPPSLLSSRTPRLLDALSRTTMPTASLSVPPKAYLHIPIPSPFRDTARATAQTEAVINPPIAATQNTITQRRSESSNQSPTFLSPTRSSIDTLRGTLQRSESMHTTASQGKSFGQWWFGENKKDVDRLLDESDRAETAEQERDGFRSKCKYWTSIFVPDSHLHRSHAP